MSDERFLKTYFAFAQQLSSWSHWKRRLRTELPKAVAHPVNQHNCGFCSELIVSWTAGGVRFGGGGEGEGDRSLPGQLRGPVVAKQRPPDGGRGGLFGGQWLRSVVVFNCNFYDGNKHRSREVLSHNEGMAATYLLTYLLLTVHRCKTLMADAVTSLSTDREIIGV